MISSRAMVFWWMAGFITGAARIRGIVESMCTATEDWKRFTDPKGGCNSKCVAQTRPNSKEAEQSGIVSMVTEERSAEKSQLLPYGS